MKKAPHCVRCCTQTKKTIPVPKSLQSKLNCSHIRRLCHFNYPTIVKVAQLCNIGKAEYHFFSNASILYPPCLPDPLEDQFWGWNAASKLQLWLLDLAHRSFQPAVLSSSAVLWPSRLIPGVMLKKERVPLLAPQYGLPASSLAMWGFGKWSVMPEGS